VRTGRGELIRDLNRARVLDLIRERTAASRSDLARLSGLSSSTVTSITSALLAEGFLLEDAPSEPPGTGSGTLGRPATLLRIDPSAGYVVGIKLAPETLTATVTDLDATPLAMLTLPHGPTGDREQIGDLFARAIERVVDKAGIADKVLFGIGIGVPGIVDPVTQRISGSPLPGWAEADLVDILEARFGLPVLVDNDVNTLTVAEHLFGAGRGLAHLLVITVGRGIGMGMVVNGLVDRGARGAAGEIGHVRVVDDGPRCWCGRTGCLESIASEPAIVREVLAVTGQLSTPEDIGERAIHDPRVARILTSAGQLIGRTVAGVATVIDPQRVVVSGEGVRLGATFLDGLLQGFSERQLDHDRVELVVEPWGDDAWARGAATLVLRELFHPAHLRDEASPSATFVTRGPGIIHKPARVGRVGGRR
jgi:N-acetylglucosamine repressor